MAELSIETRQLYHQIRQDVVSLHYQLSILLSLYRSTEHDEQVLQKAGTFFHRLYNDLTDAIVLNLARLLDPATQKPYHNASMQMLISHIEDLDPRVADQLTQSRNRLDDSYPEFDLWRNKWAAHRDYDTMIVIRTPDQHRTHEHRAILPKFKPERLMQVLKEIDFFMNTFESRFQDKTLVITDASYAEQMIAANQIPSPTPYDAFDATEEIKKLIASLDVATFG